MKDLLSKISNLKIEISELERKKGVVVSQLKKKNERLKELELLTVNQMDLFDKDLD